MSLLHLFVLAIVQGVTEFLPISSSAHLVLIPAVSGWPDQGELIDVAVHVGTLLAVMAYFHRDVLAILSGLLCIARGKSTPSARLALALIVGTLPLVVVGAIFYATSLYAALRGPVVIAWATIGFAVLLALTDRFGATVYRIEHVGLRNAALIGLAQVLALIPGTSRAGICITAARALGFERADAARFAMLLSIPAILAAGSLAAVEVWRIGDRSLEFDAILAGVLAFLAALASIALLMRWLRRATYMPFVVYRLALGVLLLAWSYGTI